MAFFDQIYERLFTNKPKGILLYEVISRNADYVNRYESWKKSYKSEDLIRDVSVSYTAKLAGLQARPEVHILDDKLSHGLAITWSEQIPPDHFQFLFDLLAERVLTLDYKLANSDCMITEKINFTETKEKHYLKPIPMREDLIDQGYGTILIEHVLVDDKPSFIRLAVHGYPDRSYHPPLPFNTLMNHLFATK